MLWRQISALFRYAFDSKQAKEIMATRSEGVPARVPRTAARSTRSAPVLVLRERRARGAGASRPRKVLNAMAGLLMLGAFVAAVTVAVAAVQRPLVPAAGGAGGVSAPTELSFRILGGGGPRKYVAPPPEAGGSEEEAADKEAKAPVAERLLRLVGVGAHSGSPSWPHRPRGPARPPRPHRDRASSKRSRRVRD